MPKSWNARLFLTAAALLASAQGASAQALQSEAAVLPGSRLQTAGFSPPTPVIVLGADAIERRSPATLGEALRELPMFPAGAHAGASPNRARMDLRALGTQRTLTLVNGRRTAPADATGAFDVNLLPTILIESVDVLTGGASAAYGSDAVAGVVDVNLRNWLEGVRGQIRYGVAQGGENKEPALALAYGTAFAGARGRFIVGGDLSRATGANLAFSAGPVRRGKYKRATLLAQGGYEITPDVSVFTEFNYAELHSHDRSRACCSNQIFRINRDSPFLTADLDQIQVDRGAQSIGLRSGDITRMHNFVAGAEGRIFGDWSWDAYLQTGKTFLGTPDQDNRIRRTTGAFNLRGHPLDLPAGPVATAVGVEWRKDGARAIGCADCLVERRLDPTSNIYTGEATVKEAFAEVGVPLVRDRAFFQAFNLNAAIRRTGHSRAGGATAWKVGAVWDPTDTLRFRAARSRDLRAPNIHELFNPGGLVPSNIANRLGTPGTVAAAGAPNLGSEIANTFTGGVVFQPVWEWGWGLRMSVDYYRTKVDGVIAKGDPRDTLDRLLPEGRIQLAWVGGRQENRNIREISGVDLTVTQRAPATLVGLPGTLEVRGLMTYAIENSTLTPDGARRDAAGAAAPHVQSNLSLTYDINRISVGLTALHRSAIRRSAVPASLLHDAVLIPGPCRRMPVDNAPTGDCTLNKNVYPASVYLNLSASYDIISTFGRRLQAFGYVENLLDEGPDVASMSILGFSPYTTVGRNFRFGLRFEF